ncbi:MAG TPA: tyrosine-type recombinase/integrase [Vicinamibacterales bacterium]
MPRSLTGVRTQGLLTTEEQERLFEVAKANHEWQHVYCAGVLAANTSMRGVEIKHVRRKDVDLDARALHIRKRKNEGSTRVLPLNDDALGAVKTMIERADKLGHVDSEHYLWCASQHHQLDPTKPAEKWDTAWRALRKAAGLPGLRFHDLRHTVMTRLLEPANQITSWNQSRGIFRAECSSTTRTSAWLRRSRLSIDYNGAEVKPGSRGCAPRLPERRASNRWRLFPREQ